MSEGTTSTEDRSAATIKLTKIEAGLVRRELVNGPLYHVAERLTRAADDDDMNELSEVKADFARIVGMIDQFGWGAELDQVMYEVTVDAAELRQELLDEIETEADRLTDMARGAARPRSEVEVPSECFGNARLSHERIGTLFGLVDRIDRAVEEGA